MYVDYIHIREWNGYGNVHIGPPDHEGGTYGIFTDTTPVDNGLIPGDNAEIYVWEGTLAKEVFLHLKAKMGLHGHQLDGLVRCWYNVRPACELIQLF